MLGAGATGTQPIGARRAYTFVIAANDLNHDQRLNSPTITEVYQLDPDDLTHDHRLEQTDFSQTHKLTINDARHEHRTESIYFIEPLDTVQNPPDDSKIKTSRFGLNHSTSRVESPFTFEGKTFDYHGERWEGEFELVALNHFEMAKWKAWLAVVEGRFRSFYMRPPHHEPRGSVTQNGNVKSINRPDKMTIEGLTASETGVFLEGDYIQIKDTDQLLMVVEDAKTDSNGETTVTVKPRIRKDPTGSTVETQDPKGLFSLNTNEPGWDETGYWNETDFNFVEVINL